MTRSRTHGRIALVVAVGALLALPTGAGAHETEAKTRAFLDSGGPKGAEGHITSPVDACENDRRVTLFREMEGRDQKYGYDMTNRSGNWSIEASLLAGKYYVKVRQDSWGSTSSYHDHECMRATSVKLQL